jgi:GT2 family glycosyltransferase
MGCAMLFSRSTWDRLGGFDERLFAYYEEVDLCLRARDAGLVVRVEPMAEIAHVGHRGFAAGFTPTAAYLKARNLWLVARRALGPLGMIAFFPGYVALLFASMALYALRGRFDIVHAMRSGAAAAWRGEHGRPPDWVFGAHAPQLERHASA